MGKILPTIDIEGTEFIINAAREELSEKGDLKNIISFKDMFYLGHGYQFHYDTAAKNLARLESGLSF